MNLTKFNSSPNLSSEMSQGLNQGLTSGLSPEMYSNAQQMLPEQNFSSPDSGIAEDFTPDELSNLESEKIEETTEADTKANANVLVEYLPEITPGQNHSSA